MFLRRPLCCWTIVIALASLAMSETKSSQFPYISNYEEFSTELDNAAVDNDLQVLAHFQDTYGGMLYSTLDAKCALRAGSYEFWKQYVLLCRNTLIILPRELEEYYSIWTHFLKPLDDMLGARLNDQDTFDLFIFYVQEVLPAIPSKDNFIKPEGFDVGEPLPLQVTIWSLDQFPTIPDGPLGDMIISSCLAPGREPILKYLFDELGLKCNIEHLEHVARQFRLSIYNLFLDHLRPIFNPDHLPPPCLYPSSVNDADFLQEILDSTYSTSSTDGESHLISFLDENPEFKSKLLSAIQLFEQILTESVIAQDIHEVVREMFFDPDGSVFCDELLAARDLARRVSEHYKVDNVLVDLDLTCAPLEKRVKNGFYEDKNDRPDCEKPYWAFPEYYPPFQGLHDFDNSVIEAAGFKWYHDEGFVNSWLGRAEDNVIDGDEPDEVAISN